MLEEGPPCWWGGAIPCYGAFLGFGLCATAAIRGFSFPVHSDINGRQEGCRRPRPALEIRRLPSICAGDRRAAQHVLEIRLLVAGALRHLLAIQLYQLVADGVHISSGPREVGPCCVLHLPVAGSCFHVWRGAEFEEVSKVGQQSSYPTNLPKSPATPPSAQSPPIMNLRKREASCPVLR